MAVLSQCQLGRMNKAHPFSIGTRTPIPEYISPSVERPRAIVLVNLVVGSSYYDRQWTSGHYSTLLFSSPNNLSSLCLSFLFYSCRPTSADPCLHSSAYYLQFSLDHDVLSISVDSSNSICRLSIPICILRIVMPMLAC
jgi:hypothetical protein